MKLAKLTLETVKLAMKSYIPNPVTATHLREFMHLVFVHR
jgi:hypothetical protein